MIPRYALVGTCSRNVVPASFDRDSSPRRSVDAAPAAQVRSTRAEPWVTEVARTAQDRTTVTPTVSIALVEPATTGVALRTSAPRIARHGERKGVRMSPPEDSRIPPRVERRHYPSNRLIRRILAFTRPPRASVPHTCGVRAPRDWARTDILSARPGTAPSAGQRPPGRPASSCRPAPFLRRCREATAA